MPSVTEYEPIWHLKKISLGLQKWGVQGMLLMDHIPSPQGGGTQVNHVVIPEQKNLGGVLFYTSLQSARNAFRISISWNLRKKGILFSSLISSFDTWFSKAWNFTVVLYFLLFCRLSWHFCLTSQLKKWNFSGNYESYYGRSVNEYLW